MIQRARTRFHQVFAAGTELYKEMTLSALTLLRRQA
jgi:hypothetical protein